MVEAGPESREELLKHLEDLTGRSFRTREDVRNFVAATLAQGKEKQTRLARVWRATKQSTLLLLVVLAFVQYYLMDTLLQMTSLRRLTVFVPVTARDVRTALAIVAAWV